MGERFSAPKGLGQGYRRAFVRALEHYRMSSPVYSLGPPVALAQALRSGESLPHPCLCNLLAVAIFLGPSL